MIWLFTAKFLEKYKYDRKLSCVKPATYAAFVAKKCKKLKYWSGFIEWRNTASGYYVGRRNLVRILAMWFYPAIRGFLSCRFYLLVFFTAVFQDKKKKALLVGYEATDHVRHLVTSWEHFQFVWPLVLFLLNVWSSPGAVKKRKCQKLNRFLIPSFLTGRFENWLASKTALSYWS